MSAIESYIQEDVGNPLLKIIPEGLNEPVSTLTLQIQKLNKCCIHDPLTLETFSLCEDSLKFLSDLIENVNYLLEPEVLREKHWFLIKSHVKSLIKELKSNYPNVADILVKISFSNRFIYMNESLLRRILINLLSNSLKFSQKSRVELIITSTNSGLRIVIHDLGIGIPENELQQVFKPFIRGSNSGYKSGWGLGLPVVMKSLISIGGNLEVNSSPGKGSEFRLFIPCKMTNEINYDFYSS